jgi:hypothetical protein
LNVLRGENNSHPIAAVLMLHLYYIEFCLYDEVATWSPITDDSFGLQTLGCLTKCLSAVKQWIDLFFSFQLATLLAFPFPVHSQLIRCIITLYRLSTFDDPNWKRNLVRDSVDILSVLDQIVDLIERMSINSGDGKDDEMLGRMAKLFRSVRNSSAARLLLQDEPDTNKGARHSLESLDLPEDMSWLDDLLHFSGPMASFHQ